MKIARSDAKHAIDLLDGIVAHLFWKGIDREAIRRVMEALSGSAIEIEEPLPIIAVPGDKLIFDCHGGYEIEQDNAKRFLTVGATYVVQSIDVGRSSTEYSLVGVEGYNSFNSVLFSFAEPDVVRSESAEARDSRNRLIEESYGANYITPPQKK